MRRGAWRAVCVICILAGSVGRANAQWIAPSPAPRPAASPFMSRYDFHLSANGLGSGDDRFSWDTHFGGDLDLFDYRTGRSTILIDYQAVLGKQLRPFDPNQGNYLLEAASSKRFGATEIAGVFHHESRHLSDRAKLQAIAWNEVQGRVFHEHAFGRAVLDLRGDIGTVIQHSFVDYRWTADADARVTVPAAPHVGVYGRGYTETFGIRHDISTRGRQTGGRAEGGVHLSGGSGAIELFAGYERVVDADAFQQIPLSWAFAGFRLLSR